MHLSVHFSNMLLLYTLNIHYLCQFVKVWFRRFATALSKQYYNYKILLCFLSDDITVVQFAEGRNFLGDFVPKSRTPYRNYARGPHWGTPVPAHLNHGSAPCVRRYTKQQRYERKEVEMRQRRIRRGGDKSAIDNH